MTARQDDAALVRTMFDCIADESECARCPHVDADGETCAAVGFDADPFYSPRDAAKRLHAAFDRILADHAALVAIAEAADRLAASCHDIEVFCRGNAMAFPAMYERLDTLNAALDARKRDE